MRIPSAVQLRRSAVFPIWDSNIETFRFGGAPPHNHMNQVGNYFAYADEVHAIRRDPGFPALFTQFVAAFNARRAALGIGPYPVSEVRAIEAAAFELAP